MIKMNMTKTLIGILIMTAVLWLYTEFIEAMITTFTSGIDALLMGFPIVMGAVVYFLADYINKMFNK